MPLLPGGRSAAYTKVTARTGCRHTRAPQWPPSPQTLSSRASHSVIAISPGLSCVGGGESVPGGGFIFFRLRFFQFQVSRRVVSVRVLLSFVFAFVLFCFSFLFVCVARAHGCAGRSRVAVARMRALACVFSCVVLAVWQACDRAWRLLSSWLSPATMWSMSVARMSHAGWCHRYTPRCTSLLVGGGVATGSRPWHLYFAFARTLFLSLFQFVGRRWRRLDVVHGMCAGYLVGCGWWGGRRVVGVPGSGCCFLWGLGFWLGVSGGWWCLAGGSRCLPGGLCDVWGPVPLRPLLSSRPHPLGGLWVLAWGRPSVGWCRLFVGGCLVGCSSFLMGWAGLAGGLSCGLCSGWVVLCGRVVVAVLVGRSGSAACSLGVLPG